MDWIERYKNCRAFTEEICRPLLQEDYGVQVVKFASPPKWHLAHTTWFFEEMILKKIGDYQEYDEEFSYLFNSYYNAVGERVAQSNRGQMSRPIVEEVYDYREYVDKHMVDLIHQGLEDEVLSVLEVGINHEEQHQELLWTDLKLNLYSNPTLPVYSEEHSWQFNIISNEFISIQEGVYEIGHQGGGFAYDNEMGRHRVFLEPFQIASSLVSNEEYLAFIENGGYETPKYWLDEGWAWRKESNVSLPMYWLNTEEMYTLGGVIKIPMNEPVRHISFYEANAFATWKGMRLPTEFEWEVASERLNWGELWEWTNSAYLPYPGFRIAEGALGEYNGKFMINQMVLRGASIATSPNHSRKTYRNFFHTKYQWQCTGIRLAK